MIVINTTKRALIYALDKMTKEDESKPQALAEVSNGFPKGVERINSSTNNVELETAKKLVGHPHFLNDLGRGYLMLVGDGQIYRDLPVKAGKPAKDAKPVKAVKAVKVSKGNVRKIEVDRIDWDSIKEWPETLNDLRDLSEFSERDAIEIAQSTIEVKALKRWQKAEKDGQERTGLLDILKTNLKRIETIDAEREKVGAGAEE
jgi:hypothetical protein